MKTGQISVCNIIFCCYILFNPVYLKYHHLNMESILKSHQIVYIIFSQQVFEIQGIHLWANHILSAQQPHVATGYHVEQHSSRIYR